MRWGKRLGLRSYDDDSDQLALPRLGLSSLCHVVVKPVRAICRPYRHSVLGLIFALALDLVFGLWPDVLQRYNRLRVYCAIDRHR